MVTRSNLLWLLVTVGGVSIRSGGICLECFGRAITSKMRCVSYIAVETCSIDINVYTKHLIVSSPKAFVCLSRGSMSVLSVKNPPLMKQHG